MIDRAVFSCIAVLALAGVLTGCGGGDDGGTATATTTATHGDTRFNAPLAWVRSVRPAGHPDEVRLVYTSVPGRPARRWRIRDSAGRHVVTLLGRPRHKFEDLAAVTSCVTIRSPELADGRPIVDGAGRGHPRLYRYLHSRSERELGRGRKPTARNCPLLAN